MDTTMNTPRSANTEREVTRVRIAQFVAKDTGGGKVIDVTDMLSMDSERSRVAITIIEFDEEFRARQRVRFYALVPDIKLVCWDILHGGFSEWSDSQGSDGSDGEVIARVLTIRRDVKYRQPYVIKIDNGVGDRMDGTTLAVSLTVKNFRATESVTVLMPECEARKLAQAILDYLRDFETVNFRKRQEAQTVVVQAAALAGAENLVAAGQEVAA